MKSPRIFSASEVHAKCQRIIAGAEHYRNPAVSLETKVSVMCGSKPKTWRAVISEPNRLYRMLKEVDGVTKVQVEIVQS